MASVWKPENGVSITEIGPRRIIGHAESHCLRKRRGYEVTGEKPFGPWLRATKGPKQWKENKWLVPAEKGICSDSKATSGNREDNMQPSTREGGSHHTRGDTLSRNKGVWRIQQRTRPPCTTVRDTGPKLWELNKAEGHEDFIYFCYFLFYGTHVAFLIVWNSRGRLWFTFSFLLWDVIVGGSDKACLTVKSFKTLKWFTNSLALSLFMGWSILSLAREWGGLWALRGLKRRFGVIRVIVLLEV
ncbi:unnamed protein product [Cuscuta epithymum]|uniref:Uncharacterized protein n=1 Tax=Cuscuta epithymum TaxID=186058 RepID=A0AAV0DZ78_9ASTE|nr:unnamed protein product [Cuscuta epithymum]